MNTIYRKPKISDGPSIYELIKNSPPLDLNSSYCYLMLCANFSETCIIAEQNSNIAGFISAYILPAAQDVLFVWQVVVDQKSRSQGLASGMLAALMERPNLKQISHIETSVTPGNRASDLFFRSFARNMQAECTTSLLFDASLLGSEGHEQEILYKIGPFKRSKPEKGDSHENI
ncbi:MAG TPA: diaminobutyrate acetyltransferase [Spirochaetota bacterium]|nr:diaminobutyrate acetyltransferase [Spirochaetota bacterium]HPI87783.1 diaminobutyrate acetyltransferase [Spirochaetota bacterium]HPR47041.1 diaminobutyrate acetyltransferase [Spirochaetota bacterium]